MPELANFKPIILWRAYVPRWAYLPLSGEGAARFGGRWNPVGVPTIYAACELSTAWAEYNQGFVQHPALIAQLELTGARLVDTTDPSVLDEWKFGEDIHKTEWRSELDKGRVAATHAAYHQLVDAKVDGVIYPSVMSPGGTCIALWRWNQTGAPALKIVDPEGRLPLTPASWR